MAHGVPYGYVYSATAATCATLWHHMPEHKASVVRYLMKNVYFLLGLYDKEFYKKSEAYSTAPQCNVAILFCFVSVLAIFNHGAPLSCIYFNPSLVTLVSLFVSHLIYSTYHVCCILAASELTYVIATILAIKH